jgi:sugar/nucleoside kinase (ribokinase family)
MSVKFDVLGLGCVAVDLVGTVSQWPQEGTKQSLESLSMHDGGLVGTAITAAARLGGTCGFIGKLGTSDFATRAVASLEKEGVDVSLVQRVEGAEPLVSFVVSNSKTGERTICWSQQNVSYPLPDEFSDSTWFERTKVLLIDSEAGDAGVQTARIARDHDIPVVVDVEQDYPHTASMLEAASHIVVSEDFARQYSGKENLPDLLKHLRTSEDQTVIITRGECGCTGLTTEGIFKLPAFKVEVVDTTGCGDVFHGAYAVAIARGRSGVDAATFASAAAALCATQLGGRDGIPTENELDDFLNSHGL